MMKGNNHYISNEELIEILDRFKSGLLSKATDGDYSGTEYKAARKIIIEAPQIAKIVPNFIKSNLSPKEFRTYMQSQFDTYKDRRQFINEEINKLILYLEGKPNTIIYEKTGWERIDDSVNELFDDLKSITDRISINEIGVRCRETLILLSNEVYIEELHHPSDFHGNISSTDVKRKFDGYFEYHFPGDSNEYKRKYAKSCNELANYLTHSSHVGPRDAKLCISATLSLIQLIKIINDK